MTLGEARARFARHLLLKMNGNSDARKLKSLADAVRTWFGSTCACATRNADAECELRTRQGSAGPAR